jgi:hypothetical protein
MKRRYPTKDKVKERNNNPRGRFSGFDSKFGITSPAPIGTKPTSIRGRFGLVKVPGVGPSQRPAKMVSAPEAKVYKIANGWHFEPSTFVGVVDVGKFKFSIKVVYYVGELGGQAAYWHRVVISATETDNPRAQRRSWLPIGVSLEFDTRKVSDWSSKLMAWLVNTGPGLIDFIDDIVTELDRLLAKS